MYTFLENQNMNGKKIKRNTRIEIEIMSEERKGPLVQGQGECTRAAASLKAS